MDLKFDEMNVDTTLAQEFINECNASGLKQKQAVFYSNGKTFISDRPVRHDTLDEIYEELSLNLKSLAKLLKENVDLFCGLEYLVRKVPIEDTKVQMHLICQQVYHLSTSNVDNIRCEKSKVKLDYPIFVMAKDTLIVNLGFAVRALVVQATDLMVPMIVACDDTKAVCYLLTKLCHKAGLAFTTYLINGFPAECKVNSASPRCIGVVSESSDVDSAVDMFLSSHKKVSWQLRRILVQESVYEHFKKSLSWKCNVKKPGTTGKTKFHFDGRNFLIDALDIHNPKLNEIIVEAYRTRKELLSLLTSYGPFYVSLWASDIAEINEITSSLTSKVIWVNNFGEFRGLPRTSDAIFGVSPMYGHIDVPLAEAGIRKLQQSWLKKDIQTRYETLSLALYELAKVEASGDCVHFTEFRDTFRRVPLSSGDSFVDIGKEFVAYGVTLASLKIHLCIKVDTEFFSEGFFKAVLYGNMFVFKDSAPDVDRLVNALNKAGVPVSLYTPVQGGHVQRYHVPNTLIDFDLLVWTKVVWTNSGTIFAN